MATYPQIRQTLILKAFCPQRERLTPRRRSSPLRLPLGLPIGSLLMEQPSFGLLFFAFFLPCAILLTQTTSPVGDTLHLPAQLV